MCSVNIHGVSENAKHAIFFAFAYSLENIFHVTLFADIAEVANCRN